VKDKEKLTKAQKVFAVLFSAIVLESVAWIVSVVWHPTVDWLAVFIGFMVVFAVILVGYFVALCLSDFWDWLREA